MSELKIEGEELKVQAKPVAWELTAEELIYPFTLESNGRKAPLFVHLKPYRASDLKQLLTETAYAVKYADEDTSEIVKSKPEKLATFFWKHFIGISSNGGQPSEEDLNRDAQKQWIIDHPRFDIPQKSVVEGFGGVTGKEVPAIDEDGDSEPVALSIFDMDASVTKNVPLTQKVFLPSVGIVSLDMTHQFGRETANEYRRYEQATDRQLINRKRQAYQRAVNHDAVESLYDSLIECVDGMNVNGEPCTASNKDKWVKLVPFWHKQFALMEFFSGIQSKNG